MKIVCFIEARYRSTRLPGKVLKPILGKPLLELMIERLKRSRTIDGIVVATTSDPMDDPLADLGSRLEVGVFRGSEDDVLGRVVGAALAHSADIIVETTGDCPLHDPAIVDKVVADFRLGGADFVSNVLEHVKDRTTPRGTDVRVFPTRLLEEISLSSNDPVVREHVSLYFWEHPEKYRLRAVHTDLPGFREHLRLTVDTPQDFELVRRIYEALYPANPTFNLCDVLTLLDENPELHQLNANIVQKIVREDHASLP